MRSSFRENEQNSEPPSIEKQNPDKAELQVAGKAAAAALQNTVYETRIVKNYDFLWNFKFRDIYEV